LNNLNNNTKNIVDYPLVSIITPTYNRSLFLNETIQSVLLQDYPRIEYIVLDDGSTDNTIEVLKRYKERIKWERHPNMGETKTVNKGLSIAHGDIISIVNSDDPLLSRAISTSVTYMRRNSDIIVVYPDWNYIDENSRIISHKQAADYDYLFMIRHHHCLVGPGAFISRKAIEKAGQRDPEFKYVADYEYWLRLGLFGKFLHIPETLATFRVHRDSASISHKGIEMAEEHVRVLKKFYSRLDLNSDVNNVHNEALCWAYIYAAMNLGPKRSGFIKYLVYAIIHYPIAFLRGLYYLPRDVVLYLAANKRQKILNRNKKLPLKV
jgi:glycosyltransferase involved in cell wall biosynthesis